jgi:glutathione peroxidase
MKVDVLFQTINKFKMKKLVILFLMVLGSITVYGQEKKSFHSFTVETLEGEEFDLASLSGKKVMVVNVASKCGLTPQYEQLQEVFEKYGGDDFTIIGFPANNFLKQEPGNAEEIREFCTENYGVTFPMMAKISVKGDDKAPVYQWLTQKDQNGVLDSKVSWNFQKYLIDENGNLVEMMSPKTKPDSEEIIGWIEGE